MKSEVLWGHFLDKPVAQRQEMVISAFTLLSCLFMVAYEVSRASAPMISGGICTYVLRGLRLLL